VLAAFGRDTKMKKRKKKGEKKTIRSGAMESSKKTRYRFFEVIENGFV